MLVYALARLLPRPCLPYPNPFLHYSLQDLMRIDPNRARDVRVTLVEAMQLLGSFDARLREYAARTLHRQGIRLMQGMVKARPRSPRTPSLGSALQCCHVPSYSLLHTCLRERNLLATCRKYSRRKSSCSPGT